MKSKRNVLGSLDGIKGAEALAIRYCDKNKDGCLTWDEVEDCIAKYGKFLPNFDIPLPTKKDFDKMAGDDGCLTYEEWEEAISGYVEYDGPGIIPDE